MARKTKNLQLGAVLIHKNDLVNFVIDKTPAECSDLIKNKKPIHDYKGNLVILNDIAFIYQQYFKDNEPLL